MRTLLALILLAAMPAAAEEKVVSPSEFREYAEGWTLYFERDGEPFGSESFGPDGDTTWRYRDGTCADGAWRPHGAQICFLYDQNDNNDVLCWRVLRDKEGLLARLLNGESQGLELRVTGRDNKPLLCGDPGKST
jgi:hypothetical protein